MNGIVNIPEDILELAGIEEQRKVWNKYVHADVGPVPRVTNIISQCKDQDSIINWAANMGRKKYDYYRNKALDTGTIVHELIDQYLIATYKEHKNFSVDYTEIPQELREGVFNAIENFKLWCNQYCIDTIEVIGLEIPVSCPWYGGTIDGILKINGAYYIVDFKTSKGISPEYLIQTAAYMWVINNGYCPGLPHIDGIGIIRVDKRRIIREEVDDFFLNDFIPTDHNIIVQLEKCFASYVEAYYRNINVDYILTNHQYNPDTKFIMKDITA
jgi:hypothetical protein